MKKLTLTTSLLSIGLLSFAQVSQELHKEPKFNFRKEYSFDSLIPKSQDSIQLDLPQEILKSQPLVLDKKTSMTPLPGMPILHPELEGYSMPVKDPDPSMQYALLILPVTPELKEKER